MKRSKKHRILSAIGAVSCVISIILSVTVLQGLAYANVTKNPLFAAVLSVVAENNRGQNKSGEGGVKGETVKEVDKGDKNYKDGNKKEGNSAANGVAGEESNGGGSVDNSNAGKDAGKIAGKGSGKDANKDAVKSGKSDKNVDKNADKASKKDSKDAKKAKSQDRDADTLEKLTLEKVKALPACVGYRGSGFFSNAIIFRPNSGSGNACAISADGLPTNFDSIRREISKLNNDGNGSVDFFGAFVYAYGSLSKGKEGLFSGKNISSIGNYDRFDVSNVTDMSYLFKDSSLTDLSFLSDWDVRKVTNMEGMFEGCTNLNDIDGLKDWDVRKVTNMKSMFSAVIADEDKRDSFNLAGYAGLMNITSLEPLKDWNVSNVTNMDSMFEGCGSLEDFTGLENWKTKKVESMNSMFRYCMSIGKNLNAFQKWDVSKVTGMRAMFAETQIQNTVGIEDWNVSNVTAMDDMFANCFNLVDINKLSNWATNGGGTSRLTSTFRMFYGCNNISSIEPLKDWKVDNVKNMHDMFNGCSGLTSLSYIKDWNVGNVTKMDGMFKGCKGLSSLSDLANWKVDNVTDMHDMFNGCKGLSNLSGLENWNVGNVTDMNSMFNGCADSDSDTKTGLTNISALSNWAAKVGNVTNMSGMFSGCELLNSISDLKDWNVDNVTDMHNMFNGCKSLSSLSDLKDWNVGNVTNMSGMFADCKKLTSAEKLSNWATKVGNVTNMSSLFSGCELLANISDLKDWKVDNVTDMNSLFSGCKSLSSLSDLAKWKVDNVTDMHDMFEGCIGLSNLSGLKDWNVGNVANMCEMFSHSLAEGTDNLTDISALSGWNVSNVKDMSSMFADCKSLTGSADLSKWDISKVTNLSLMFSNAGAGSGDSLVLDFSNKTFTKSSKSVYKDDDGTKHYFSVDSMFDGFKGTLIANNLKSSGFENNPDDDPIAKHFASGDIFSIDEKGHSNNIVITNNVTILDTISNDDDLKKITYYIPVKAKLMEPGDIKNDNMTCDCNRDLGGTTYTYYVPALYNSSNLEKKQDEKSQDYAYRIVKNSFASKFRSAIDSQSGEVTGGEEPGEEGAAEEESGGEGTDYGSRSATLKLRVKKLQSVRDGEDEEGGEGGESEGSETGEEHGNAYKIMFKKPASSGDTCSWTELGDGDSAVPVSNPKSPLIFFTTTYYLETFVQPVPLPHTGGQSAVMFTFLSIGLFSMFAVSGAFARHGWVARRPA
ncbi:BspA family leucine-rich repeat surface protein [uncultured Gardnerella sp.]|uniref:BspA family leucine-rich repeat surface protein n=1 Tax=uncultured Gardnerella sp. TaxID=293424 RepID=UPI0025EDB759|nr:BspA family leucine-rich repeat surface protein [uncultured Gardnerella sp.]